MAKTDADNKYKNYGFNELISFSENNPNRSRKLESIEIQKVKSIQETPLDPLGLKGYQAYNLSPNGILSVFACIEDPSNYTLISKSAKSTILSTLATTLQEKTDNLKNTHLSRKRKRIYELISNDFNQNKMADKDYIDLYQGLSYLNNVNIILMKSVSQDQSESGEIINTGYKGEIFFSSDPSCWRNDTPIWIADFSARWIAIQTDIKSKPIKQFLAEWITNSEQNGWFIEWPDVDSSKEELIENLSKLPTWSENDKKLKKDVLSKRLGKAKCIQLFTRWSMKFDYEIDD